MSILELTIDVETIPTQSRAFIDALDIKCPGNIKKPDSVQKWRDEVRPGLIDNAVRKTSLDSTKGELIVIGWAINDGAPECVYRDYRDKTQTEADLLQGFYDAIFRHFEAGYYDATLWIGHSILSFDLPYLWHRSKINGIKPTVRLPYNVKPWSESIFDTKLAWKAGSSASSSLHDICQAIGIANKSRMKGSEVWGYAQRGEIELIADYCMHDDVEATRALYKVLR